MGISHIWIGAKIALDRLRVSPGSRCDRPDRQSGLAEAGHHLLPVFPRQCRRGSWRRIGGREGSSAWVIPRYGSGRVALSSHARRLWGGGQLAAVVADTGARLRLGTTPPSRQGPSWWLPRRYRVLVTDRVDLTPEARDFLQGSIRRERYLRNRPAGTGGSEERLLLRRSPSVVISSRWRPGLTCLKTPPIALQPTFMPCGHTR